MMTPIVIVGAGIGGLAAALDLAAQGRPVLVLERAAAVGGKMRQVAVGDARVDAGPTVFTMRAVFERLFADAGARLEEHVALTPAALLARHAWPDGSRLDLFADIERSAAAIAAFAGAKEADGYRRFCARAAQIYRALEGPFIQAARPTPLSVAMQAGPSLLSGSPFATLWSALGGFFADPRLRQLFGRYATYVGSSPFACPATLMLVAHVEQAGVWFPKGGMHAVARAVADLAVAKGATIRCDAEVAEIGLECGRAAWVRLAGGERIAAAAVLVNADASSLGGGLFGQATRRAAEAVPPEQRSLSAVTWAKRARCAGGFVPAYHNVVFSADYRAEFDDLFTRARLPAEPTVYVCAQDRADEKAAPPEGPERLLVLVNAPARDGAGVDLARAEAAAFGQLARCGLQVEPVASVVTGPAEFAALFPASGGALYGRANHGWAASFSRPGATTRVPGLYLAGGSAHPGAGVPMAALSGRMAAAAILRDTR